MKDETFIALPAAGKAVQPPSTLGVSMRSKSPDCRHHEQARPAAQVSLPARATSALSDLGSGSSGFVLHNDRGLVRAPRIDDRRGCGSEMDTGYVAVRRRQNPKPRRPAARRASDAGSGTLVMSGHIVPVNRPALSKTSAVMMISCWAQSQCGLRRPVTGPDTIYVECSTGR